MIKITSKNISSYFPKQILLLAPTKLGIKYQTKYKGVNMQNIIKRVIRILVSGYIVKMIRNLISKILTIAIKQSQIEIKTELISNSVLYCPLPKYSFFL